ncbi:hypothetical protein V2H45_06845 [Tumidithrix elongata RA019]|uniref:ABC transporter permease n=1 Tax=Tumidithrix elongata BACA0141 TaxID=2716417 RepID=A0AAW9PRU5_9CYAN|nr:hypothetical protein [Tumidithrix elongata RA019]
MTAITWLDRVGNWNPQLLREFRGRLKPRTLAVAIIASVLVQFLLVLFFSQQLPSDICNSSRYCWIRDWQTWWLYQFRIITWGIPYVLFLSGVFSLIADLTQEERKGTLNFIRLSPRSSASILIGKILGVPILPYISILLIVPLHLITAAGGGVSWGFMLSYYLILITTSACLFSGALLVAFLSNSRLNIGEQSINAILYTFLTFTIFTPIFFAWNLNTIWSQFGFVLTGSEIKAANFQWFYLPIARYLPVAHLFIFFNLLFVTLGIWQLLKRRFHNPSATILSKQQSYVLSAYVELFVMGFFVQGNTYRFDNSNLSNIATLIALHIFHLAFFFGLISTLSPNRQSLLDWARYSALTRMTVRNDRDSTQNSSQQSNTWGYLLRDLVWAEKSPAPVAIAVNILITHTILLIWIYTSWQTTTKEYTQAFFILASQTCIIMIYAVLIQLILLGKMRRPEIWAAGTTIALFSLPPIILSILSIRPANAPALWQFLGFPWIALPYASQLDVTLGFLGQIFVILFLSWQLSSKLQRAAQIDG